MARIPLTQELELIESLIASHPEGLGISALESALAQQLGAQPQRRTLQRRLQKLIEEQRLCTEGESIVLVYKLAPGVQAVGAPAGAQAAAAPDSSALDLAAPATPAEAAAAPQPEPAPPEPCVPLSPEGAAVAVQVRRAPRYRCPIGYQPEFLHAYQPGVTFYLPEALRASLHALGRSAQAATGAAPWARALQERLCVDLAWSSARLAGQPGSRQAVHDLLVHGRIDPGQAASATQMVLNHQAALEMLLAEGDAVALDAFTFQNLHAVLSQDLLPEPHAGGRLRQRPIELAGTVFAPLAAPALLQEDFALLLAKAGAIPDALEQAFFVLAHLPYLQPFDSANQRVARLGANIALLQHGLCPLSFIDVPPGLYQDAMRGVYELNDVALLRDVFVWAYERSCQRRLEPLHALAAPDPLKLQYRQALIEAVQSLVQSRRPASAAAVAELAQQHAAQAHRAVFAELLTAALEQLHEGSIARYRLRRADYRAWQQAQPQAPLVRATAPSGAGEAPAHENI